MRCAVCQQTRSLCIHGSLILIHPLHSALPLPLPCAGRYIFMHNGVVAGFMQIRRRLLAELGDAAYNAVQSFHSDSSVRCVGAGGCWWVLVGAGVWVLVGAGGCWSVDAGGCWWVLECGCWWVLVGAGVWVLEFWCVGSAIGRMAEQRPCTGCPDQLQSQTHTCLAACSACPARHPPPSCPCSFALFLNHLPDLHVQHPPDVLLQAVQQTIATISRWARWNARLAFGLASSRWWA